MSERSDRPDPDPSVPVTLSARYFDDMYEAHRDPWNFETSPYEAGKYDRTLAALPNEKYTAALEVGCSIGVLTARLAPRCTQLLSLDLSQRALDRARERCAGLPQVRFERREMPAEFPSGRFDLLVLSEVLYYLSPADLQLMLGRSARALLPGGHLLAVHWTPVVHDYPQTGDQVHGALLAAPGLKHLHGERHEQYRLDLFERV
ncbi:class I SAM-dependent methyltransferase (plasmid) [Deinococcus radiomollis]|uniref:class I SAM-dependent DNA methyltransferase n=1 Tax=Deinococcus radiomollis TaxID=468916 RepID=UPI0038915AF9